MRWISLMRNQWDRAAAWAAAVGGAVALLLGYLGISRTSYTPEQLPYLVSGGAFGLFLLGVAAVLWVTADLRDEWRKLDDVDGHLTELLEHARAATDSREQESAAEGRDQESAPRAASNGRSTRPSKRQPAVGSRRAP
jgi:hypothetical protein